MMLYICIKFCENVSTVFKVLSGYYFQTEIFKGYNSLKYVGQVMVLNLCTSSYDALYLYQVISQRVSKFLGRHDFQIEIFKGE